MFHQPNLTCSLCFFTATNHEQWGNHIISNHSNIFLPLFPNYESFQNPQLQYQPLQQVQQPFQIRPAAFGDEARKSEPYPSQHQAEEKENKSGEPPKQDFVSSPSHQPARPVFVQKQELPDLLPPQENPSYSHNPYQFVLNQFHKCPYCQYLGSTQELLQNHIQAQHTYNDKIYSDLKPVTLGYGSSAGDATQLISLIHQEPQQQQEIVIGGNPTSVQAASPTAGVVLSNFTAERHLLNGAAGQAQPGHVGGLEITQVGAPGAHFCLDKGVKGVPDMVPVGEQVNGAPENKISLITVQLNKGDVDVDDEGGITGVVVVEKTAQGPQKRRQSRSDGVVEKHLRCEFCDKAFKRRDHMNKHIRSVHTTDRNFECGVCFKKYSSEGTLKQHVQNSHSQKLQQCQFCEKAFARKDHLTKHVQGVHLKERKFVCPHCNKSYTSQGALLQHVGKAHLEKNFTCDKCGRKFATNIRLQIHIQETSLMSSPFPCEVCGERFTTAALMLEHSVKSHKIKAWRCDICNGHFKGKYILQAHIKKMHKQ